MVDATSEAGKKALKVFRVLGQFVAKGEFLRYVGVVLY
jgi:hypothetical protein